MKRPLTDFFSDKDIRRSMITPGRTTALCLGCEQKIGDNGYYRLASLENATSGPVCPSCMRAIRRPAIAQKVSQSHLDLSEQDLQVADQFSKLGDK